MKKLLSLGFGLALAALVAWRLLGRRDGAPEERVARAAAQSPFVNGAAGPAGRRAVERTSVKPASAAPQAGATLAAMAWGAGPRDLGRSAPGEGDPQGPMSVTVDRRGDVLVLDQVNGRIQRWGRDGTPLAPINVTQRAPQDVAVGPDGSTLVLDRLGDGSVAVFGPDGAPRGELPVVGKSLEEGGAATGLFVDKDGVYVEKEHGELVRVGDAQGDPDPEQPTLDGRPTRDGKSLISAAFIDPRAGTLWVRALDRQTQVLRFQRELALSDPLLALVLLDSDAMGGIYVGAHVGREQEDGAVLQEAVQVICLAPTGEVRGVAVLPANTLPDETFRDLAVTDDGAIVYLVRTATGAELRTYRCS